MHCIYATFATVVVSTVVIWMAYTVYQTHGRISSSVALRNLVHHERHSSQSLEHTNDSKHCLSTEHSLTNKSLQVNIHYTAVIAHRTSPHCTVQPGLVQLYKCHNSLQHEILYTLLLHTRLQSIVAKDTMSAEFRIMHPPMKVAVRSSEY